MRSARLEKRGQQNRTRAKERRKSPHGGAEGETEGKGRLWRVERQEKAESRRGDVRGDANADMEEDYTA